MAKIYFARHQMVGVLWQYPFAAPPTDEQLAAVEKLCFQQCGDTHPKTGAFWIRTVEVDVLSTKDVPVVPERSLSVVNEAGVAQFGVEARGHVENPR